MLAADTCVLGGTAEQLVPSTTTVLGGTAGQVPSVASTTSLGNTGASSYINVAPTSTTSTQGTLSFSFVVEELSSLICARQRRFAWLHQEPALGT